MMAIDFPSDTGALAGWLMLAYLVGSVPTGLLVARAKGVDIRKVGSGNIGATNVFRSIGKPWGVMTFIGDALKGLIPALLFPKLAGPQAVLEWGAGFGILCAVAAILGHNFSLFLRFKGGKGVATSAGALIGIAPLAALIGVVAWVTLFFGTRYVSVASIGASLAIPLAGWILYQPEQPLLAWTLIILGALVILRHKANIQRLIAGTEHRFNRKKEKNT